MPLPTRREIRKEFEKVINAFATTNSIPIAFENVKFTPPSTVYLRCFLLPSPPKNTTMCYGTDNPSGVFQVDVVGELNKGAVQVETLAEQISAIYPEGVRIGAVRITAPVTQSSGISEKERYVISLSAYYSYI